MWKHVRIVENLFIRPFELYINYIHESITNRKHPLYCLVQRVFL